MYYRNLFCQKTKQKILGRASHTNIEQKTVENNYIFLHSKIIQNVIFTDHSLLDIYFFISLQVLKNAKKNCQKQNWLFLNVFNSITLFHCSLLCEYNYFKFLNEMVELKAALEFTICCDCLWFLVIRFDENIFAKGLRDQFIYF